MSLPSSNSRVRLIVALDYPTHSSALQAVEGLETQLSWVKVGLELYLSAGAPVVHALRERGFEVFLDLKLHDIPNTVAGAVRSVADTGAGLLTIHAGGGPAMIASAANEVAKIPGAPKILAVTVLTSMDFSQLAATGVTRPASEQVAILGRMAIESGADGLVCSGEEVAMLRSELGEKPLLVVPGIRPAGAVVGDQKRVMTPGAAIQAGASKLVVGRPITQAANPAAAVQVILEEVSSLQTA